MITAEQFTSILGKTLSYEGQDLNKKETGGGGVSRYGITQDTYNNYLKNSGRQMQSVDNITPQEVHNIYYNDYFLKHNLQNLPPKISAATFDFGVNSGPSRAIKDLQQTIGTTPDGIIGPKTLQAVNTYVSQKGEDGLLQNLIDRRREYVNEITTTNPKLVDKRAGLLNRVTRFENDYLPSNNGIRNLKE